MSAKAIESAKVAQKMIVQTVQNVADFAIEVIREQANLTKLVRHFTQRALSQVPRSRRHNILHGQVVFSKGT